MDDITSPPDLKSHSEGTGPTRKQHPVYNDLLAPCNMICPAGENIQAWMGFARAGKFEKAWQGLMEDNPLPAVCGGVCYHTCEDQCNRPHIDSTMSIHAVERFIGDEAVIRYNPALREAGKNPFVLDSPRPTVAFRDYARNELRYTALEANHPEEAAHLLKVAQEQVNLRWKTYEDMAGWRAEEFMPVG